jgi:transposase
LTHLRTQLVESAWAYRSRPAAGVVLQRRQAGLDPAIVARSWTAQQRLSTKFRRLDARKTNRKIVVTAIARELAGFVWAEMTTA